MKPNKLIEGAAKDRHESHGYTCKACGSPVSTYSYNSAVGALAPKGYGRWDWLAACDNAECQHARGDGYGINGLPEWVKQPA